MPQSVLRQGGRSGNIKKSFQIRAISLRQSTETCSAMHLRTVAEIRPNRIGNATAAYATHHLTCLVLEKDQRPLLHVAGTEVQRGDE